MKKGKSKYSRQARRRAAETKVLVLLMVIALTFGGAVGGTVAWLITKTDPVVNTFTYGDINITLTETDTGLDDDNDPNTNTYKMMPGNTITKDPKVTVKKDSEESWVFVKLEKSEDFDDFLSYEMEENWVALDAENYPGVYYIEVGATNRDIEYGVIKGNAVTVKDNVTKEMLNDLTAYPRLTITAYAVQRDSDIEAINTAAEAWNLIEDQNAPAAGSEPESGTGEKPGN
ncbi:MAG: hypothetical protein IJ390_05915 [Lachnospiraceae bacterium]|nr:hypothetical protein [Lachnospiraceae bacterium]